MEEALDTLHKRELHKSRVRVRKVRQLIAGCPLKLLCMNPMLQLNLCGICSIDERKIPDADSALILLVPLISTLALNNQQTRIPLRSALFMLWRAGAAPVLLWRGRCGLCVPVWRLHTRPGDPGRRGPILGGILRLRRMRGSAPLRGHVFGAWGVEGTGTGTPWERGRPGLAGSADGTGRGVPWDPGPRGGGQSVPYHRRYGLVDAS